MKTKFALRLLYEPVILSRLDGEDATHLINFFTNTLGIADCTWETYIDELKELKASGCGNIDSISVIYTALNDLRPKMIGLSKDNLA